MNEPESTSRLLRERTAPLHERVDAHVRAMLEHADSREAFLRASADVVMPWEEELRRFTWPESAHIDERLIKTAWLKEDLGDYDPAGPRALAANRSEAWGALYVMEGSTLGATAIRRILPAPPSRYLQGYGDRTRSMWTAMQAALDAEVRGDEAHDAAVRAAERVFGQFEEALRRHG